MKQQKKHATYLLLFILKFSFLSGFLYYIYQKIDIDYVLTILEKSDWHYVSFSFFSLWFGQYIAAFRWQYLLKAAENFNISIRSAFFQIFKGYALSQVLPSSVGGDVYRLIALKKNVPLKRGVVIILIDRMIGLSMFFLFSLLVAPFFIHTLMNTIIGSVLSLTLCLFLCGVIFGLSVQNIITKKMPSLTKYYTIFYSIFKKEYFLKIFLSSFVCGLLFVLPVYFIGCALQIPLGAFEYYLIMPIIFIATALPISFAGWGVREGMFMTFLTIFGIKPEMALALSLVYGVVYLIGAIPALALFFLKDESLT